MADRTREQEQRRPDAEIILSTSASVGLVAIPVGEQYRWADTALLVTNGFERHNNGVHVLRELKAMPQVMPALARAARQHRVVLTASPRPYLGDYAHELVTHLPGTWRAKVEVYAHPVWQEDWMPLLWDSGELTEAMEHRRIPYGAVLSDGAGTELLLIEHPGSARAYLLGACATSTFDDNYQNPYAPKSVTLPAFARLATSQVATEFLPAYERALHERLLAAVEAGHARLHEIHRSQGGGDVTSQNLEGATTIFRRLRPHAAHLLDRARRAPVSNPEDSVVLDRLRSLLNPAGTSGNPRPSVFVPPRPLTPASADEVDQWLADGPTLLKHARTARPSAPVSGVLPALAPAPRSLAAPERMPLRPR
ncbi:MULTISPECIES: hypothetical protein [Streptomyces]|uniref:Uncharacterized protein n=2 Tax=Streptomyces TaxID=1883 RepID=A0A117IWI6_9ACTN|nr:MULTISPECIES: hypothetical protein [Streptomyces]KUH38572.1 hypothetical protein ATE80_11880 [Streptomyces kanasensis]UUS33947.1 hypothetical protein NRO40_26070 [Streptomyces changanensis]